jgi:transcriptional regulator with XRE-family HTH domain
MDTLIPSSLRRQRNLRRLTLDAVSTRASMSAQHLSQIESGKRDPRLSSIERIASALGMTVLVVPNAMATDLRLYIANNGRSFVPVATPNQWSAAMSGKTQGGPHGHNED